MMSDNKDLNDDKHYSTKKCEIITDDLQKILQQRDYYKSLFIEKDNELSTQNQKLVEKITEMDQLTSRYNEALQRCMKLEQTVKNPFYLC